MELRSGHELRLEDHHDLELLRDLGVGRGELLSTPLDRR